MHDLRRPASRAIAAENRRDDAARTVRFSNGQTRDFPGSLLPAEPTAGNIRRTGSTERIDVDIPADWLLL